MPFTRETARAAQMRSTFTKRARKDARHKVDKGGIDLATEIRAILSDPQQRKEVARGLIKRAAAGDGRVAELLTELERSAAGVRVVYVDSAMVRPRIDTKDAIGGWVCAHCGRVNESRSVQSIQTQQTMTSASNDAADDASPDPHT